MARPLSFALGEIMLSAARDPIFRVEVFDLLARDAGGEILNTLSDVVRDLPLSPTVGPRDFTPDVLAVSVDETAGDFSGGGVAASRVSFVVSDPSRRFDPATLVVSPGGDGRWLRRGNGVRIYVGDAKVPAEDWPLIFTGRLVGQAGARRSRVLGSGGPVAEITVAAVSREADFLRYPSTSETFGQGVAHSTIVESIATSDMGLDLEELALPGFSPLATEHVSTQFVDEPPLVSIARAMFPSGLMPRFTGEGKLGASLGSIERLSDRTYSDESIFLALETPFAELSPINRVVVRGLAAEQSRVVQPRQVLAEVSVTTGYFTFSENIRAFWSEDRTIFAENVELRIVRSVNGGLVRLGGDESFSILTPGGPANEGSIGAVLEIDTGFAPELIIFLTATYLVLALIPDEVVAIGGGITIPLGRLAQATQLALMLLIMLRVGRGIYEFVGDPFEYVFAELTGIAEVDGLRIGDRVELDVENHLLSTQAAVNAAARDVLFREQAKGNPRRALVLHDLALEPDDIFEVESTGRRYLVSSIRYQLRRGVPVLAECDLFEVTSGAFL